VDFFVQVAPQKSCINFSFPLHKPHVPHTCPWFDFITLNIWWGE
jgi:hypothetical protein